MFARVLFDTEGLGSLVRFTGIGMVISGNGQVFACRWTMHHPMPRFLGESCRPRMGSHNFKMVSSAKELLIVQVGF